MFVPTFCPAGVDISGPDVRACDAPVTVVVIDDDCGEVHAYCSAHAVTHGATGCVNRYFRVVA